MAKWSKIDVNGNLIGEITKFPPANLAPDERITFVERVFHNSGNSPEKFHTDISEGDNNVTAKFIPGSPRGKWEIEAVAGSVAKARELVNKILTNLGLHGYKFK